MRLWLSLSSVGSFPLTGLDLPIECPFQLIWRCVYNCAFLKLSPVSVSHLCVGRGEIFITNVTSLLSFWFPYSLCMGSINYAAYLLGEGILGKKVCPFMYVSMKCPNTYPWNSKIYLKFYGGRHCNNTLCSSCDTNVPCVTTER